MSKKQPPIKIYQTDKEHADIIETNTDNGSKDYHKILTKEEEALLILKGIIFPKTSILKTPQGEYEMYILFGSEYLTVFGISKVSKILEYGPYRNYTVEKL